MANERVHRIATGAVAFVWLWHGLVPKLLGPHPTELAMLTDVGVEPDLARTLTLLAGVAEVAFAFAIVRYRRERWPWFVSIGLMVLATIGAPFGMPQSIGAAFNPITLNVQVIALSAIALVSRPGERSG